MVFLPEECAISLFHTNRDTTGAIELLPQVALVYSEVSFRDLYHGQMLVDRLVELMRDYGFATIGVDDVSQSLVDGTFLQANFYFARPNRDH